MSRRGTSKAEVVEYRGNRYRRYPDSKHKHHRNYFHATEPRRGFLHRHIWEDNFGPIPDGFDVHHRSEDTTDNSPGNLECISKLEHRRKHRMQGETLERQKRHLDRVRDRAAEWHASDEGREWHRQNSNAMWEDRPTVQKVCECCGQTYNTFFPARANFCGKSCAQYFRAKGPRPPGKLPRPVKKRGPRNKLHSHQPDMHLEPRLPRAWPPLSED